MAPLNAGFATLDPGHLGDLGQSSGLGGCPTAHPGGHCAEGGGDGSRFGNSAAGGGGLMSACVCRGLNNTKQCR